MLTQWCNYTIFGFAPDYVFHCQYYFVLYYFPVLCCFILNIKVFDVGIVPLIWPCLSRFFAKTKRFSMLVLFPLFAPVQCASYFLCSSYPFFSTLIINSISYIVMCLKTFLFNYHRNSQVNHSIDKESKTKKVIEYENKEE